MVFRVFKYKKLIKKGYEHTDHHNEIGLSKEKIREAVIFMFLSIKIKPRVFTSTPKRNRYAKPQPKPGRLTETRQRRVLQRMDELFFVL